MQAIITLRSRRQVDNQVVHPNKNPIVPKGQDSGSTEERDAEPSIATPTVGNPPISCT